MKYISIIINWFKSHILITVISAIVLGGIIITPIVIHNLKKQDIEYKTESNNNDNNIVEKDKETFNENKEEINNQEEIKESQKESTTETNTSVTNESTENNNNNNNNNSNNNPPKNDSNNNSEQSNNSNEPNKNENNNNNQVPSTPKPAETHVNEINLNENVLYFEVHADGCNSYVYVSNTCMGKTIKELVNMYPDYDKNLTYDESESNTLINDVGTWVRYFPKCMASVTESLKSKLNSELKGYKFRENHDSYIYFDHIVFKNDSYAKYVANNFAKYNLIFAGGCGSNDGTINYKTLDESTCQKYNLSCGRW